MKTVMELTLMNIATDILVIINKCYVYGLRSIIFTFLLILSSSIQATETEIKKSQFSEPLFGVTINKKFIIIPRYTPKENCVSIENDDTIFYISKSLLEKTYLADIKNDVFEITGPLHPEKITEARYSKYAKIILDNQLNRIDAFGCNEIKATLSSKTLYLIKRLLNSGQVSVLDKSKNKFTKKITVKYTANHNSLGRIAYLTATIPSKSIMLLRWEDYL